MALTVEPPAVGAPRARAGLLLAPLLVAVPLLLVLTVGAGSTAPVPPGCGSAGTAATVGDRTLTAEQMGNAQTIVGVVVQRRLPPYAAVVAVAASWTEAQLINDPVQHDHDSLGLFQIRAGLHGAGLAGDPVRATSWFLDALVQVPGWQSIALAGAAAAVERPAAAYRGRYTAALPLATAVVAMLWPSTAAALRTVTTSSEAAGRIDATGRAGARDPTDPDAPDPPALCPVGGGPSGETGTTAVPCTVGGAGQVQTGPGDVPIRVCAVGPLVVDTTIAGPVQAMVTAAAAAGLRLGGSGYRSTARQIALRRANCGPTDYDISSRPASECSPPTAPPGSSMHEWGLALDLTSSGELISSHRDPAWQWLSAHAASYGLHNLPSEAWHWSTNGH